MARREYGDEGGVGRMAGGENKRMRETEKGGKRGVKERKWGCGVGSKGGEKRKKWEGEEYVKAGRSSRGGLGRRERGKNNCLARWKLPD